MSTIIATLIKAQQEFPVIPKTKKANMAKFSYKYADLAEIMQLIKPVLTKYGLFITQTIDGTDQEKALVTKIYSPDSTFFASSIPFQVPDKITNQEMGSMLTYYRRYGLCTALGLVADEDIDGLTESINTQQTNTQTMPNPPKWVLEHTPEPDLIPDFEEDTTQPIRAVISQIPELASFKEKTEKIRLTPQERQDRGLISEAQVKRLWAIAKKSNWSSGQVKDLIEKQTEQRHADLIPWQQYKFICEEMEFNPKEEL